MCRGCSVFWARRDEGIRGRAHRTRVPAPAFNRSSGRQDCQRPPESRRSRQARRCLRTLSHLAVCVFFVAMPLASSSGRLAFSCVVLWRYRVLVSMFAHVVALSSPVLLAPSCLLPLFILTSPDWLRPNVQTSEGLRRSQSCGLGLCTGRLGTWRRKCSMEEEWVIGASAC